MVDHISLPRIDFDSSVRGHIHYTILVQYTLNAWSRGKQLVLFSPRVLMFPETNPSRETSGLQGKQNLNQFPKGPYIKCFVIYLDFPLNKQQKKYKQSTVIIALNFYYHYLHVQALKNLRSKRSFSWLLILTVTKLFLCSFFPC